MQGFIDWKDRANDIIGYAGYKDTSTSDFWIRNAIGNIVLSTAGHVDVTGELKIKGGYATSLMYRQRQIRKHVFFSVLTGFYNILFSKTNHFISLMSLME